MMFAMNEVTLISGCWCPVAWLWNWT